MKYGFVETVERRVLFAADPLGSAVLTPSGVLEVTGTRRSDEIHVTLNADVTKLDVVINGAPAVQVNVADITGGILVSAGNGKDLVTVDAAVTLDATLLGGNGKDVLSGGGGNDRLEGGNGNDVLSGGAGNDTLFGDNGKDVLDGGDGDDVLSGGRGRDAVTGGLGADSYDGDALAELLDRADGESATEPLRGGRR